MAVRVIAYLNLRSRLLRFPRLNFHSECIVFRGGSPARSRDSVKGDQPVFRAAAVGKRTVPGATVTEDIELIIDDRSGGGGGKVPPAGGDGGGDGDKHRRPRKPSQRLYSTAIALAMASILMFFLGLCTAFIVLMHVSGVRSEERRVGKECRSR